ncbi:MULTISPECIES: hypothetical protein [Clostridia]|nr:MULTISPECIES: hypothetical protein [Clostridia]
MDKEKLKVLIKTLVDENNDEKYLNRIYISLLLAKNQEKGSD